MGTRPDLDLSFTLDGRVNDIADAHDMHPRDAYEDVIKIGATVVEGGDLDDLDSPLLGAEDGR